MKALKIILIVILVLAAVLYGLFYYFFRMTKAVNVTWTEADYTQLVTKAQVELPEITKLDIATLYRGNFVTTGSHQVTDSFSSSEITAILQKTNNSVGPITNIKANFLGNNEAEVSFVLQDSAFTYFADNPTLKEAIDKYGYLRGVIAGTPIYLKGKLNSYTAKTVNSSMEELLVGNLPMSGEVKAEAEKALDPIINTIMSKYDTFAIDKLSLDQGKLNFSGTLPAKVEAK